MTVGYECASLSPNQYQCQTTDSYLLFDLSGLVGSTVNFATIFLFMDAAIVNQYKNTLDTATIDLYVKKDNTQESGHQGEWPWFPMLTIQDWSSSGWTRVNSFGTIAQMSNFLDTMAMNWWSLDVTSIVSSLLADGYTKCGFKIVSSASTPPSWSYTSSPPSKYAEAANVISEGPLSTNTTKDTATGELPYSSFLTETGQSQCLLTPWLRVGTAVTPPSTPYSTITSICADPKAFVCLAGTASGNLWMIYYDTVAKVWNKNIVYSTLGGDGITAVYIDGVHNFKDYKNDAIVWFGTNSGNIYRGSISTTWNQINAIAYPQLISFIKGSEINSDNAVIATGNQLLVSTTGKNLITSKVTTNPITGLFVRGTAIQMVCNNSEGYQNPGISTFGDKNTWYADINCPPNAVGVAFSSQDHTKSIILANTPNSDTYLYDSGTTQYRYQLGATIDLSGTAASIDFGLDQELGIIGDTTGAYLTSDYGSTFTQLWSGGYAYRVAMGLSPTVEGGVAASNDATLSALGINAGILSPTFASGTTSYTASVVNFITSIFITPTANQANATITVNGTAVMSGVVSQAIPLLVGANTITIKVTAQDGSTTNPYTIIVTRGA
jgi:hypothetical protein